jgi:hypothetical protein
MLCLWNAEVSLRFLWLLRRLAKLGSASFLQMMLIDNLIHSGNTANRAATASQHVLFPYFHIVNNVLWPPLCEFVRLCITVCPFNPLFFSPYRRTRLVKERSKVEEKPF